MIGEILRYGQYVVIGLLAVLAADMVLDRVRMIWGQPKNEKLRRAWAAFDKFCDQLRKIVGSGPLGQLTRESVEAMAGVGYDVLRQFLEPVWTREAWIEAVLRWYDEQIAVEQAALVAYARVVPAEVRGEIEARGRWQ